MYSKRRQPRKQATSRSGLRKTQRGGRFSGLSSGLSGLSSGFRFNRDKDVTETQSTGSDVKERMPVLDTLRELQSGISNRVRDGISGVSEKWSGARGELQPNQDIPSRSDELQATDAALNENTATANDVETLQKRLDAIEQMLNNLNDDFRMLLNVFTSSFHSTKPPENYNAFRDIMSKQLRDILAAISQRD